MAEGDRDLASQIFGGSEVGARPTASRTNSNSNAVAGPSNAAASTEQSQTQKKKKMKKKDKQDGEGKKKKKKKKRKEREESYDSQDEAPDDGDLNAEEFIVDAILHAIYKPFAANRNLGGCAWHYICLWHGYPPSQTSDEDPITHDMFSPGSIYVEEFWKYSRGPFERQYPTIARSSTARKGKHPSEPLAKMGDSWECPPHLLNKWYREARYAYRKDLRIASARVIEKPKSLKWADRKKNMIKWIRWTNMKIAETAQDSQSHGLRLLSANEDGDGDSSSSEYEGSSDDEETSEEEALIKKAKVDDRKRDRRVDSSPSKSDGGRKRRLESSPSKSEDERKKKQRRDQDRGKGKDREGERSRDPTVTPRAWSPGLYTAGASPESKKKEEKRQKMEKLKRQRERRERREEAERKRKEDEASDVIEIPSTAGSFIEIPSTAGPSTSGSAIGTAGTTSGSKTRKVVVSDSDSDEDVPLIVQQPAIKANSSVHLAGSAKPSAKINASPSNPISDPSSAAPVSATTGAVARPIAAVTIATGQQPLFEAEEEETPVEESRPAGTTGQKYAPIWARDSAQTQTQTRPMPPAQGQPQIQIQSQSRSQPQVPVPSSTHASAQTLSTAAPAQALSPTLARPEPLPLAPELQPPQSPRTQPREQLLQSSSERSTSIVHLQETRESQTASTAPAASVPQDKDATAAIRIPAVTIPPAASSSQPASIVVRPPPTASGPTIYPSRAPLVTQPSGPSTTMPPPTTVPRPPASFMDRSATSVIRPSDGTSAVFVSGRSNTVPTPRRSDQSGLSQPARPTTSVVRTTTLRGFKLPCQIDIRLPGMTQRTELFVSDLAVQPLYTGVTPSALFAEPRSMKRLVITRLMAADVIQDLLLNRAVIAHAKVQIVEGPQYAHGNRMMGDFLRELGEEGLREARFCHVDHEYYGGLP
ncbi:hypothetical protein HD553DRAFT_203888 [Filobasidium floriforme]|uniref:uncharacterized protein n=1 Tax=Filobasidium floriforme TaxID=5210 RepID=UPI001E8D7046|nr:uncharacterized protein HD553DRAFT_203888 [Filobasidium floriforme]KAH8086856.1 hypothetical protein HD553DRAFT_203888 [Filobasidium floriforme]